MIATFVLALAGIAVMLWLLFTFAVYALPFYAGLSAAMLAYRHDAGLIGAAIVGLVAAVTLFGIGQLLFATLRSPLARGLVASVYAAPAGLAGYHAVHGLFAILGTGDVWRALLASVGAVAVAAVAWARVSALHPGGPGRGGWQDRTSGTPVGASSQR